MGDADTECMKRSLMIRTCVLFSGAALSLASVAHLLERVDALGGPSTASAAGDIGKLPIEGLDLSAVRQHLPQGAELGSLDAEERRPERSDVASRPPARVLGPDD